jgi:hypothetical protein
MLCLAIGLSSLICAIPAFTNDDKGTWSADSSQSIVPGSSMSQPTTSTDDGAIAATTTTANDEDAVKQIQDQTTDVMSKYGMWTVVAIIFGSSIFTAAVIVLIVFMIKHKRK